MRSDFGLQSGFFPSKRHFPGHGRKRLGHPGHGHLAVRHGDIAANFRIVPSTRHVQFPVNRSFRRPNLFGEEDERIEIGIFQIQREIIRDISAVRHPRERRSRHGAIRIGFINILRQDGLLDGDCPL